MENKIGIYARTAYRKKLIIFCSLLTNRNIVCAEKNSDLLSSCVRDENYTHLLKDETEMRMHLNIVRGMRKKTLQKKNKAKMHQQIFLWWTSFCTRDQIAADVDGVFRANRLVIMFFFQLRFCNAIFRCSFHFGSL